MVNKVKYTIDILYRCLYYHF